MKTITLNIPDDYDYSFLLKLLRRLGLKVESSSIQPDKNKGKKMTEALNMLAASGGINSISDPIQWQKENRKDRNIID